MTMPATTTTTIPTKPLAAWTYTDAAAAVDAAARARIAEDDYNANERYLLGDHWQDGDTWVGPRGTVETESLVLDAVKRQFTPVGVIGEALERVANGLLKREAAVSFAPVQPAAEGSDAAKADQAEAGAMVSAVSAWWDRVKLWEHAREAVMAARALTRGVLRVSVPEGMLVGGMLPADLSLDDAFRRVHLAAVDPAAAALIEHPTTLQPVAVVLYTVGQRKWAELWTIGPVVVPEGATVAPETARRVHVRELNEAGAPNQYALSFDRLPVAEIQARLLITEAVRRQQARLDFGESMLVRTMETGGFPERYIINAEYQGTWSTDDSGAYVDAREINGVMHYLYPEARTLGASVTTELRGIEITTDDAGRVTRATPAVTIKEPTDPKHAITANEHSRAVILTSCHQAHVLANGDAAPSGYSREQARADFEDDLSSTKTPTEGALRSILEAGVAYALAMTSDADLAAAGVGRDFLTRFRCVVTVHADSGPLSPDERRAIVEEYRAGLRSRASALAALGEEDIAAAETELDGDPSARLGRYEKVGAVLDALARATSLDGALRLLVVAGVLTPEEAAALAARDTDGAVDDGAPAPRLEAA